MGKLVAVLIFVAGVLSYGYYHQRTHGSLSVTLYDPKEKPNQLRVFKDEVTFLDANGRLLARAKSDEQYGVVRLIHPVVGDCVSEERGAMSASNGRQGWQDCFEQQSTWLMSWVRKARYVAVNLESCAVQQIPISIRESGDDWWLWWVPLPHIGGNPYSFFSLSVTVDRANCARSRGAIEMSAQILNL